MLHSRRNRLRQLEEREAAGEDFWSESFPVGVRNKLLLFMRLGDSAYAEHARAMILSDEGLLFLTSSKYGPEYDYFQYLQGCVDGMMPTVIEAWADALMSEHLSVYESQDYDDFEAVVNLILREHRISFELLNGEMVPMSSRELHVEVTIPTLRLLAGDPKWGRVEAAYQDALAEIASGNAADAVTDAGTALQEALTILGCEGNALGPLIKSAKAKGLLSHHDGPMLDAVYKVADWVSADRSNTGDAHNAKAAHVEDAWLIVHIVGALILRLSKSVPRP